jgi:3,4-dihydroxy 2-butanone 4-phosphate synthase / GTP cyclohydrolase II
VNSMTETARQVTIGAEEAIERIRLGEILIVTDDEDRENEGDFLMAAEKVDPEAVNFMVTHGRGLLCHCISAERARELELPPMAGENTSLHATAFTVSVDARDCTSTGISAADRAATIRVIIDPDTVPEDLLRPGHIFPLTAAPGGLLQRPGHTEAAVQLPRLAGLYPSGIICEVMDLDGSMARLPRLMEIAEEHNLKIVTIRTLVAYLQRMKEKEHNHG